MTAPFVSVEWWRAHAEEVCLVVVSPADPTQLPPGAVVFELDDLAGPATDADGRHPLPTPEAFAALLGGAGISPKDTVVATDDAGGVLAARLVWMLRALGRPAALLDGVLRPDDDVPARPGGATEVPAVPWPERLLADAVAATDPANLVLDARPRERYLGAPDPLDPRPGHLPGSRSLPCRENLGPDGLLLPDGVLRAKVAALGVTRGASVVSTCGSGVTACHTLLVLEHLGLPAGRLYPGSWSQYAADPAAPVELGPA